MVGDLRRAGENIVGDDGAANRFTQFDLRLVPVKFTTADKDGSAFSLDRGTARLVVVPVIKNAITEPDDAAAAGFGDLIAWPPKGAVHEAHRTGIIRADDDHRRVRPVKGGEFAVGDQQAER